MSGRVFLMVSATADKVAELRESGPRRDFLELASATDGQVIPQPSAGRRSGWRAKLFGPHVRQAWQTAGRARRDDTVFADGEHNGIPLLLFLRLRIRRGVRVVMLGHLLSRRWKRTLLRLATFAGRGTLVVHSRAQAELTRATVGRRWNVVLLPYQVDTRFWTPADVPQTVAGTRPLVVAVGSENRDYDTLAAAAAGLPARVLIAAGSHWARETATAERLPGNVAYLSDALPFEQLRDLYRSAAVVVVPLRDVPNQSGVTTILEAMSCGRAVVVTASEGQQECVTGPMVRPDGTFDPVRTAERGPAIFGDAPDVARTGVYVPVGDVSALHAALERLLRDHALRRDLGAAARDAACRHFSTGRFVTALASLLRPQGSPGPEPAAQPTYAGGGQ
jgi:glycosyltransferase involved in cell wall biosynthesis